MSIRLWLLASFALVAAVMAATAQSGERPAAKWFGPGVAKATAPAVNARRLAEIAVEGTTLSVRGFVPDKAVRDHTLRLARLYCSFSVVDAMKEHPSLRVRPGQMAPAQLQTAVVTALREALPKQQAQRLHVECAADGKVTLRGPVPSFEEKLAASLALRRLFGCTSVQNLTEAPGTPDLNMAKAAPVPTPKADVSKKDTAPADVTKGIRPAFGVPTPRKDRTEVAKADKSPPKATQVVEGPNLFPSKATDPPAKKDKPAKASVKLSLSPAMIAMLQKRVAEACPGVKDVKIEVVMNKLRIELTVRSDDQINAAAEKVFNVPELADYRDDLELVFAVGP
jgi:hypothetical protein